MPNISHYKNWHAYLIIFLLFIFPPIAILAMILYPMPKELKNNFIRMSGECYPTQKCNYLITFCLNCLLTCLCCFPGLIHGFFVLFAWLIVVDGK